MLSIKRKYPSPVLQWFKTKSEVTKTDELDVTKSIMKPILFLLLVNGIDVKQTTTTRCLMLVPSAFFHFICLGMITFKITCLVEEFQWDMLITLTLKATPLLLWWLTWLRRHNICALLRLLENLSHHIECEDVKRLQKLSKIVSVGLIFIMCTASPVLSLRYISSGGNIPKCIDDALPPQYSGKIAIILLHEFSSVYVNYFITCTVAIFYAIYCTAVSFCLKRRDQSETETWKIYQQVLEIFNGIESVMSLLIFIVFAHVLSSLFKDIAILIEIMKKKEVVKLYFYLLDFIINALGMVMIVLSADCAQNEANAVRFSLFSYSQLHQQTSSVDLNRQYIKLAEERELLKLSAWGMFLIKKPFIISIVTGLITYGVIIFQFSGY